MGNSIKALYWLRLYYLSLFAIAFYVFMEWLFFVTKPSFMDMMGTDQKFGVFFITTMTITGFFALLLLIMFILSNFSRLSTHWKLFIQASAIIPAIFLSTTSLLMMDNFTYTIFRFGIVNTEGLIRGLYGLIFLFIVGFFYRWTLLQQRRKNQPALEERSIKTQLILCSLVLPVSFGFAFIHMVTQIYFDRTDATGRIFRQPHIILFGGDGINAMNMSVYGYERDTTPNLRQLAETSLLAENAFTNSANSAGSITSILTGKLPTRTRVVYPPNILMGTNAFQHLPGILQSAGYFTAEIGTPYYIDAIELNLQEGFDLVNQRPVNQNHIFADIWNFPSQMSDYFIRTLSERIIDRIFHIFFIQRMPDPYREVVGEEVGVTDQDRFNQLTDLLGKTRQPLFVHIHMMTTHGPTFPIRRQVFSVGQRQDQKWMEDFYDDAIFDFDDYVGEIVNELSKKGLLENTILVIYSDHNHQFQTDQQIPLIFYFPGGEIKGRVKNNVQNLDIAPTILDYLNLPIPNWMEGESLIASEPNPTRMIFSTGVAYTIENQENDRWEIDTQRTQPPFYQYGFFQAIVCNYWYYIDLAYYEYRSGKVASHTQPCNEQELPDSELVRKEMMDRLEMDGFDIRILEEKLLD